MIMNIFYTGDTLYINVEDEVNNLTLNKLKSRVFGILDDYNIDNVVLNVISEKQNNFLLNDFISSYHDKYSGNLIVR